MHHLWHVHFWTKHASHFTVFPGHLSEGLANVSCRCNLTPLHIFKYSSSLPWVSSDSGCPVPVGLHPVLNLQNLKCGRQRISFRSLKRRILRDISWLFWRCGESISSSAFLSEKHGLTKPFLHPCFMSLAPNPLPLNEPLSGTFLSGSA